MDPDQCVLILQQFTATFAAHVKIIIYCYFIYRSFVHKGANSLFVMFLGQYTVGT